MEHGRDWRGTRGLSGETMLGIESCVSGAMIVPLNDPDGQRRPACSLFREPEGPLRYLSGWPSSLSPYCHTVLLFIAIMPEIDLVRCTLRDVVEGLTNGEITSEELIERYLGQ